MGFNLKELVAALSAEEKNMLLGLPIFLCGLVAKADGQVDQWESAAALKAINRVGNIDETFRECQENYGEHAESWARDASCWHDDDERPETSLVRYLKRLIPILDKYGELMDKLPAQLQKNIRGYVFELGRQIAEATVEGSPEAQNFSLRISRREEIVLSLIFDSFGIRENEMSFVPKSRPATSRHLNLMA